MIPLRWRLMHFFAKPPQRVPLRNRPMVGSQAPGTEWVAS